MQDFTARGGASATPAVQGHRLLGGGVGILRREILKITHQLVYSGNTWA